MYLHSNRLILVCEIIAIFMDKKETKPLKVTEHQQKVIDVFIVNWKEIWGTICSLVLASFFVGKFFGNISDNKNINQSNLELQKKLDDVRAEENKNCDKIIQRYSEMIKSITPNNSKNNEK